MLEYQRACPQENHPDVAGLHLRLPPLFLFCFPTFLSFFITLTSSILSPSFYVSVFLLSSSPLISLWLSSSFFCLSVLLQNHSSHLLPHLLFHLCFLLALFLLFCPFSLKGPQCCEIWFPNSQNCKVSWDPRSKSEERATEKGERERERGIESAALQTLETTVASPPKHQAQRSGPREIGWPSFHFSRSDIKHKQKGPRHWNKALMSRRLFSLEGTGSARANPWRYEIPVRMCLEWLVVRPLASIKPTAELLLVMPDILTALRGAGAEADTRVFEVKHTVKISHPRLHKHTHTHI